MQKKPHMVKLSVKQASKPKFAASKCHHLQADLHNKGSNLEVLSDKQRAKGKGTKTSWATRDVYRENIWRNLLNVIFGTK